MHQHPPEDLPGSFDTILPTIHPDSSPPPAAPESAGGLAAMACADQRRRWSQGERVLVEAYLEQFPQLSLHPEIVLELLSSEYLLRSGQSETISTEEYLSRFPSLREALIQKFAWHATVAPRAESPRNPEGDQPGRATPGPTPAPDDFPTLGLPLPACAGSTSGDSSVPFPTALPEHPNPASNWSVLDTCLSVAQDPVTQIMPPLQDGRFVSVPGFEILEELGRGGMGVVYQARHLRLKRIVALKMILAGAYASPQVIARFLTEAQAVARLQHPNIVQIHEIGEQGGLPFFSLEFVEGGNLERELAGRPQEPAKAVKRLQILAHAIHAAHEKGIVHRDLKPANVLLTPDGTPKITDFGLAKDLGDDQARTEAGSILGTPSYMAPEQAFGQLERIGPLTDVHALGAILYEMLTGRPPFLGATTMDTLFQVRSAEPVPVRRLQPGVPRDLETICSKCLQKDPAKRYASASDLADDLGRWLEDKPIQARPTGFVELGAKWVRRNPALAALLLVIFLSLLSGVVGGVWFTLSLKNERDTARFERQEAEFQKGKAHKEREKAHHEREMALANARLAQENAELARKNEAEARKNGKLVEEQYRKSVQTLDRYCTLASQSTLLTEPGMETLRQVLLRQARKFYSEFLGDRRDDPHLQLEVGRR